MEITSAKKYREGKTKVVTLPSGDVFMIKKPGGRTMAKVSQLFEINIDLQDNPSKEEIAKELAGLHLQDNLVEIMDLLIPGCVVEPKVSLVETHDEHTLFIDDIEYNDLYALLDEIMAFSGLSEQSMKERESFQQ